MRTQLRHCQYEKGQVDGMKGFSVMMYVHYPCGSNQRAGCRSTLSPPEGVGVSVLHGLLAGRGQFLLFPADLEIALTVVVIPTAGHRVILDFSVDHVMYVVTSAALCIGLHVYSAGLWVERAFLQHDRIRAGIHRSSQSLAVPFQFDRYLIAVGCTRSPITRPRTAQRIRCRWLPFPRRPDHETNKQANHTNSFRAHIPSRIDSDWNE